MAETWFDAETIPLFPDQVAVAEAPKRLTVISRVTDMIDLPVREYLIEPRYPVGDVTLCVGEPGILQIDAGAA